jgi:hypothetical protein
MKDGFTFHVTPASAERLAATAAATSLLPARVSSLVAHALRQRFEDDLAQRRKLFEHHREVIRTATPVLTRIGRRHGESTDYGREVGVPRAHAAQGCADLLKQQPASPNLNRIHSLAGLRAGSGLDACIVEREGELLLLLPALMHLHAQAGHLFAEHACMVVGSCRALLLL